MAKMDKVVKLLQNLRENAAAEDNGDAIHISDFTDVEEIDEAITIARFGVSLEENHSC